MAQNSLTVSDLDFDKIKANLKDFMRSQAQFKDYDFDGSSLSILIDLLAYNTHYNAYYANMIANEMFLDTAVFRESVVSKAKMLGYTPKSRIASEVYVNIYAYMPITGPTAPNSIQLDAYAQFKSSTSNKEYTFITLEDHILEYFPSLNTSASWCYKKNTVKIVEGTHLTYSYEVQVSSIWETANPDTEHYIIPSGNIDISALVVCVQNSASVFTKTTFRPAGELQTITGTSPVYWLHEIENTQYEIKFGDGANLGVDVGIGNIIIIDYVATNGPEANGCRKFTVGTNSLSGIATLVTLEPVQYRLLELTQNYSSDFIYNETVYGNTSKTTGTVEQWDKINKILKLVSVNGIFALNETVSGMTSGSTGIIKMSSIETSKSFGGTERESIDSIKNIASKSYQTQGRCVTIDDYATIIKREYPNIRAIKIWGGDTMVPPVYGKVFIALRPHVGQILNNSTKEYIRTQILGPRSIITVQTEIVDPDYIFIVPTCEVKYNPSLSALGSGSIVTLSVTKIVNYAETYLNDFSSPFYSTNLSSIINSADASIVSNILKIKLKKFFDPTLNVITTDTTLDYNNAISKTSVGEVAYDVITSSTFTYAGISGCELSVSPSNYSILQVVKKTNGIKAVVCGGDNVGTVDYTNGKIRITNFLTSATTVANVEYPDIKGRIEIFITPEQNDIFSHEHQILDIQNSDISVSTVDVRTLL